MTEAADADTAGQQAGSDGKPLAGRVALVSGGGRGIGRAICRALAADGAAVGINYRRDERAARATADAIQAAGGQARIYRASIEDHAQAQAMVRRAEDELGPIGILVNNAGIASRGLSVVDTDPAEVGRVMGIDAFGSHSLCKHVIPRMRSLPRGDIIMISSTATRLLAANGAPYNMAKAALEALAATLAREERQHGIRVNTVAPGLVDTEMGRRLMRATAGIMDMRALDPDAPFGRVCRADDVAQVVRYLVSPANTYLTGEKIYCDGGGALPTAAQ